MSDEPQAARDRGDRRPGRRATRPQDRVPA